MGRAKGAGEQDTSEEGQRRGKVFTYLCLQSSVPSHLQCHPLLADNPSHQLPGRTAVCAPATIIVDVAAAAAAAAADATAAAATAAIISLWRVCWLRGAVRTTAADACLQLAATAAGVGGGAAAVVAVPAGIDRISFVGLSWHTCAGPEPRLPSHNSLTSGRMGRRRGTAGPAFLPTRIQILVL